MHKIAQVSSNAKVAASTCTCFGIGRWKFSEGINKEVHGWVDGVGSNHRGRQHSRFPSCDIGAPWSTMEHHGAPWSTTALGETELCGKLKEIEQPQPTSQGDKEEGAVFRRQHCLHLKVILSVVKCHTLASFHIACFSMLPSMVSFASRIGLESRIRWKCEWDNKASEDNWSPEMLLL